MAVNRDMLQVDQGVLLFLASDGLGRPIAALLLSDVSPPFEEEELEKEERDEKEEGSNVENGNEVDINNVLKVEKADIGMKERLELATGLEVVIFWGVFRFFLLLQVSPFTTLHLGLYLCLAGRSSQNKQQNNHLGLELIVDQFLNQISNPMCSGRRSCLSY